MTANLPGEQQRSVKDSANIDLLIRAHPWAMVIGATAIGYLGTRLLCGTAEPAPVPAMPAAGDSVTTTPMHSRSNGRHGPCKPEKNGTKESSREEQGGRSRGQMPTRGGVNLG
jgi:hypothetical protein